MELLRTALYTQNVPFALALIEHTMDGMTKTLIKIKTQRAEGPKDPKVLVDT